MGTYVVNAPRTSKWRDNTTIFASHGNLVCYNEICVFYIKKINVWVRKNIKYKNNE